MEVKLKQEAWKILLIEDDKDDYILTRDMLAEGTHGQIKLEWASSYERAQIYLKSNTYDVVLLDYNLGARTGLDFVRETANQKPDLPFILLTGQENYELDIEAMKVGVTDYLVKQDVTPRLLERAIRYAIERKLSESEMRKNYMRSEILAGLSQKTAEVGLEYRQVLDVIAQQVTVFFGDSCVIHLLSEDGAWLNLEAYHAKDGSQDNVLQGLSARRERPGSGLFGTVFEESQPTLISELSDEALNQFNQAVNQVVSSLPFIHSCIIVPLKAHGRTIGTLSAFRHAGGNPFTRLDQDLLEELADRSALDIENARLYYAEMRRAQELDGLQRATSVLLSTLDLELLLGQILDAAMSAIPAAEKGVLYMIAQETGQLQVRVVQGYSDPRIKKTVLQQLAGYPAKAVREQKPLLIDDARRELISYNHQPQPSGFEAVRSLIVVPMILNTSVIGVLSLNSTQPGAFVRSDLRLLISFATTATTAIKNARLHAEVQKLAITDTLTGFHNRRGLAQFGQREVDRAQRYSRPLSLIMIDIDHFKQINDEFGHTAGDQVLATIAGRIRNTVRELDILGRYGGDEFVVILPETDLFTASAVAERIRQHLLEPMVLPAIQPTRDSLIVTASIGVTRAAADSINLLDLIDRADQAAYAAKSAGRDRVVVG
ncbi:MAG: diguanylate cyclase [Anaerolineales bacterium]